MARLQVRAPMRGTNAEAGGAAGPATPTRRGFLATSMAGAVLLGFSSAARAEVSFPVSGPTAAAPPAGEAAFEPSIWCSIAGDGVVTVNVARAEMGQHVGTALARVLVDELEADWNLVRITYVDSNPKWGYMVTGGSWSVWQSSEDMMRAGAAGRIALVEAAAKLLGTTPEACTARNGVVTGAGQSIPYGQIVTRATLSRSFTPDQLKALPLKPVSERRYLGKPMVALDIPAKTNGSGIYGIDVTLPGMVYARPKMPPTRYGSKVTAIDDSAARSVPGYLRSIALEDPANMVPGWVVVYAETYWAAMRACDLLKVTWTPGEGAGVSDHSINERGRQLIATADAGTLVVNDATVDNALSGAAHKAERVYTTSTVMHFQLEPMCGVALQRDGVYEIHTGNQWQSLALPALAKALDLPAEKIVLKSYLLGGGFGRRLNGDYTVGLALASKAIGGKPVKLILTRADDMLFDSPRSPSIQLLRMGFDAAKKPVAMEHHAAAGWPTQCIPLAGDTSLLAKGVDGKLFDPFAIAGADNWYDIPQRVRAIPNDLANRVIRPGWLRSVAPGWTNWALESFMDEMAHETGQDPLAFRVTYLNGHGRNAGSAPNAVGGALRQAAVLKRLAEKVQWGKQLPADSGLGFATSFGQERGMPTWIACAAQVKVDRASGRVQCEKLTIVCDAGVIVDPDGATAQCEGGALWGLSMALHEGTTIQNGNPAVTNLDAYTPLRLRQAPEVEVEFLPSTEKSMGLGEPATTVVAPAIGNAIFHAVGVRLRSLPIRPDDIKAALQRV